jgi:hypothetical protein
MGTLSFSLENILQINAGLLNALGSEGRGIRVAWAPENFVTPNVQAHVVTLSTRGTDLSLETFTASYGGRTLSVFLPELLGTTVTKASNTLEQGFQEQANKWASETEHLSSPAQMMLHPSYQAILGMAREDEEGIIRLMLRDLRDNRRLWFWALSYLTKENPIKREDAGKLDRMIKAWVDWGKQRGKL